MNPGPPALKASTLTLGYRGGDAKLESLSEQLTSILVQVGITYNFECFKPIYCSLSLFRHEILYTVHLLSSLISFLKNTQYIKSAIILTYYLKSKHQWLILTYNRKSKYQWLILTYNLKRHLVILTCNFKSEHQTECRISSKSLCTVSEKSVWLLS